MLIEVMILSKFTDAAKWLNEQHKNRSNFENFNDRFDLSNPKDAYEVQEELEKLWVHKGQLVGYKLGLTSKPIQALFGVNTPIKGNIFSKTVLHGNQTVDASDYVNLGIEFELAVEIGEDFSANCQNLSINDCMNKVAAVYPAFELIDDRNANYSTVDLISATADNSWNANSVLGQRQTNFKHLNFENNLVRKTVNDKMETSVTGAALGNPFNSVLWIASLMSGRGQKLRDGQIIMTGSTFATHFPQKGDIILYEIEGLGEISLEIKDT